jgi:hypothetical protein
MGFLEFLLNIIQLIAELPKLWEAYERNPRQTCLTWLIVLVFVMVLIGVILATRP